MNIMSLPLNNSELRELMRILNLDSTLDRKSMGHLLNQKLQASIEAKNSPAPVPAEPRSSEREIKFSEERKDDDYDIWSLVEPFRDATIEETYDCGECQEGELDEFRRRFRLLADVHSKDQGIDNRGTRLTSTEAKSV
jgi:hypothetical protein